MRLRIFIILTCIALNINGQSFNLKDYKLILKGKEISIQQFDSLQNIYPSFSFDSDNSTTPISLNITPLTKEDLEEMDIKEQLAKNTWVGKKIETFEVNDIDNRKISYEAFKDKIIVLNFYFTTCGPCIREMPELNQLVQQYKRKDVVFIAFALDKPEKIKNFLKKHNFEYIQIPSSDALTQKFKISTWPTHVIINKKGIIKYYSQGFHENTINDLKSQLKDLVE